MSKVGKNCYEIRAEVYTVSYNNYAFPQVIKMIDGGCRLPPPPGLPKELYKIMIQCWYTLIALSLVSFLNCCYY